MDDLGLSVSINQLSHHYDSIVWERVIDFASARATASSGVWPLYIGVVLEEPNSSDEAQSWVSDYIGSTGFPTTGYELLDELADEFTLSTLGDIVPDALILEEIDNWAEVADRPLSIAAFEDHVAASDVRDLIDAIQSPVSSGGLEREAWAYLSARGAVLVGLEAWALGGDINTIDPTVTGEDFENGDFSGLEVPLLCRRGSDRSGGVLSATPDDTVSSSSYFEVLMAISPSFLHVDRTGDEYPLPTDATADEGLVLRTYTVTGSALASASMNAGSTYNSDVNGLRFLSTPEEVELAKRGNVYASPSTLTCNPPKTTISPTPSKFRIQAECSAIADGSEATPTICDKYENQNYGYVADLKMDFSVLTNCGGSAAIFTGGTSTYVTASLPSALTSVTLPAVHDGYVYSSLLRFFPWAGTAASGLFLKVPFTLNQEALEDLLDDLLADPDIGHMPFCIDTYTHEADLDMATPVRSKSEFLSESNQDYRYLDKPYGTDILLNGIIMRDSHGMTPEEFPYFDDEAQERLLIAISEATDLAGGSVDLVYIETLSWFNEYDGDWVRSLLNNVLEFSDGLIAGDFAMSWWQQQTYATDYGEFVEREEITFLDDRNLTPYYIDDDFDVRMFFPQGKKTHTIPGWYQKYTTEVSLLTGESMTFEWDVSACSQCVSQNHMDMVIEFQAIGTSDHTQAWIINEDYSTIGEESDFIIDPDSGSNSDTLYRPIPEFYVEGEGTWEISVYMYSLSEVSNRRHAYFRLVDPTDDDTMFKNWIYESGILAYSSGIYPVSLDPSDHPIDTDQLSNGGNQAKDMLECIGSFFTNSTWEPSCP